MTKERKTEVSVLAIDILTKYQINSNPGEHLSKILEGEKIELIDYHEWPDETCGRLMYINGIPVIYYNAKHKKEIQAFTIAHELGHYFLNHLENSEAEIICIDRDFERYDDNDDPQKELEVEANYFAACLLLPRHLLQPAFSAFMAWKDRTVPLYVDKQACNYADYKHCISYIKERFLASESAIRYRLISLNWMEYNFKPDTYSAPKSKRMTIAEIFNAIADENKHTVL